MLILQVADRTNPQAGPMNAAPLKPYTEKRSYLKGKMKKGELEVDYLIQLMAWNPDAPSLQPITRERILHSLPLGTSRAISISLSRESMPSSFDIRRILTPSG